MAAHTEHHYAVISVPIVILQTVPQIGDRALGLPVPVPLFINGGAGNDCQETTCTECGFVMEIRHDAGGAVLIYDVEDWRRRCKYVELGGPVWCLLKSRE